MSMSIVHTRYNCSIDYDTTSVPCGTRRFMSSGLVGCPTDAYKFNQFLKTQLALDKELIRVSTLAVPEDEAERTR